MLVAQNVLKQYGDSTVLRNASLTLDPGEFVAVVGPSGSGKSTMLNVLAGLLTPTEGEVTYNGMSLYEMKVRERVSLRQRSFGFVFQSFNLIPYLTARENVELPMYLDKVPVARQKRLALELLDRFDLQDKADRLPNELSVGEQQRVAIARAVANSPRVIFADEPTGNLDRDTGISVMQHFCELNQDGVAILFVTHDIDMANFARRRIRIVDGGIQ